MSLVTNIISDWELDDGSPSTTAVDATGNGYTGTFASTPVNWTTSGYLGGAVVFNGTAQSMSFSAINIAAGGDFTFRCAFSTTSALNGPTFFSDNNGNYLKLNSGRLQWFPDNVYTPTAFNDGAFHELVLVVEGTSLAIHAYIDGAEAPFNSNTLTVTRARSFRWIGSYQGTSGFFPGTLDICGFWDRAFTAAEAASILGLSYPFSGGSSSSLFRRSQLNGLGAGGPFFNNPLRSMIGWAPNLKGLLVPDRRLVAA